MKILLYSPASTVRRNGNHQTSSQWVTMLREAGHEVRTISHYEGEEAEIFIALHAVKSREAVLGFKKSVPKGKIILALTGTDIYPAPSDDAIDTMRKADALVTLQRRAIGQVPEDCRDKVVTIIQSAKTHSGPVKKSTSEFNVAVVGHLRDVKDPLLTAKASRRLPASSKIRIRHVGGILESQYAALVAAEEKDNPRYDWLGELSETETAEVIASSHLMVLSSLSEGGARVVGESIVHGTPVLSSRIAGVVGLVGDDYPGLFEVGGEKDLAAMLSRAETDPDFYATLKEQASHFAGQFAPETEKQAILKIVNKLGES
ncbi:MAG: selenoneine biosynthesis selenosugar synthase SenB [Verrucomicrobiales bacterium]|nr:selenoneine biosynthesis selenosugar synthase SenB [Verrucomicrobiales bacterium]